VRAARRLRSGSSAQALALMRKTRRHDVPVLSMAYDSEFIKD